MHDINLFYPSDFVDVKPFDSVLQNSECETIARNIMVILNRLGNVWRHLEWHEYEEARKKDTFDYTGIKAEQTYFEKVVKYTNHWQSAACFCDAWEKIVKNK